DAAHVVRDQDDLRVLQPLLEDVRALLLEPRVADRHHLVDQVVVEVEGHAEPEREARAHSGGIARDRLIEIIAELGEIPHEADLIRDAGLAHAMDAADELHVVASREALLQASGKTDGPRDRKSTRLN